MFNKKYLTTYKLDKFQPLNSGCWHFTLILNVVWFWGLFTTKSSCKYLIYDDQDFNSITEHWQELIKSNKPLN